MCDRETATTQGCHLGYTDTLIALYFVSLKSVNYLIDHLKCVKAWLFIIRRPPAKN